MSKTKFFPGWKMTFDQHNAYFYWLGRVYDACGLKSVAEREAKRQEIHHAAFGRAVSAKEINHLKMFDDFKAACLAVLQPANLEAQMRQAEMPKTRLINAIRKLSPEAYIIAEFERKRVNGEWSEVAWDDLGEADLTKLRNHLAKRAAHIRWPAPEQPEAECPF